MIFASLIAALLTYGPGVHEVTDLELRSGDTLVLEKGARLVASSNCVHAAVWARNATNIVIRGEGTIDGNGAAHNRLRAREPNLDLEPFRWGTVVLECCRDVRIEEVEMLGASGWTCHLDDCVGVTVRGVRIFAHANFNNDGIDIESSDVLVEDCDIDSEDDAIVFKTKTPSKRVENVRVRNCRLSSDSSYIKVGTESWGTFRDIRVESCELSCRTPIRVRNDYREFAGVETHHTGISAMEVSVVDGGNLDGVVFRNLTIGPGVITPLFVRLAARHPAQKGRATFLRNVLVENVRMTSPTTSHIASSISGECGLRPSGVTLRNCEFLFKGGLTPSEVTPIVENPTGYPSPWGAYRSALPAYGLFIRRADDVVLSNVGLRAADPKEARPSVVTEDAAVRPEITWSILHPTKIDLEYVKRVVKKAAEYGTVDSFEVCGDCHGDETGLNALEGLRELVELAGEKPVYYWHREVSVPDGILKSHPEFFDERGEFDLLGTAFEHYLRGLLTTTFESVPKLGGVVLTLTESKYSVVHNSDTGRYPPREVVEKIVRVFAEEHAKRGKRFILRSFGSNSRDYADIIGGAVRAARDHGFEIETKVTEADFVPFLPINPFLEKHPPLSLGAECDALGEFLGAGLLPAAQVGKVREYVAAARERGAGRYAIRIDRVGNSIFDSAHEVNLYAYHRFIADPDVTADEVLADYARKRFGAAAEGMIPIVRDELELVRKIHYVASNLVFHVFPLVADLKTVKAGGAFSLYREGVVLDNAKDLWSILDGRLNPTHAEILAEKAEGVRKAREALKRIEGLRDRLPADEYVRQSRAFANAVDAAEVLEAFAKCCTAYFDDMGSRHDEPECLARASEEAIRLIESKMTDPKDEFTGECSLFSVVGGNLDRVYYAGLRHCCRQLLVEYRAERMMRKALEGREDVLDFVIPGGIYDDCRTIRTMHGAYPKTYPDRVVRMAGNPVFPNGTIEVRFREVPGARTVVELDESGASTCEMTERVVEGFRFVRVGKRGCDYPAVRSISLLRPFTENPHLDCEAK